MIDPKLLDDLTRRFAATLPAGVKAFQDDLQRNLAAMLESALSRLDLVTREEFEVQRAVLARTREQLETLALQVAELEKALAEKDTEAASP